MTMITETAADSGTSGTSLEPSRSSQLRAATEATHARLDQAIMAGRPFESVARYWLFLRVQHAFHRDIAALYSNPALNRMLPDLAGRCRLRAIADDLADIGLRDDPAEDTPQFNGTVDIPTALGWLYVAEGSNLGAAFLLKEAAKLGLSESFGARHLAGAAEGRGLHWRSFTQALDGADLTSAEEGRVIAGGVAAFDRVEGLVRKIFG